MTDALSAIAPRLVASGLREAAEILTEHTSGGVIYDGADGQMDAVEPEWHYTDRFEVEKAIPARADAIDPQVKEMK